MAHRISLLWLTLFFCKQFQSDLYDINDYSRFIGSISCGETKTGATNATDMSHYYSFTAEHSQFFTFNACKTNYDTRLSIHTDHENGSHTWTWWHGSCDDDRIILPNEQLMASSNCTKCKCQNNNNETSCVGNEYWEDILYIAPYTYFIEIEGSNWDINNAGLYIYIYIFNDYEISNYNGYESYDVIP
eukprot:247729_1